jgi:4-alpha-glucanotransferase
MDNHLDGRLAVDLNRILRLRCAEIHLEIEIQHIAAMRVASGDAGRRASRRRICRDLLEKVLEHCLGARSLLCVLQLQELLDLDGELWSEDPREDRINVPGTVADTNWTWRMPLTLEQLSERRQLAERIRAMAAPRRDRTA